MSACTGGSTPGFCLVRMLWLPLVAGSLAGCGDDVRRPSRQELTAFTTAGAVELTVDMAQIEQAKLYTGPYRVVAGDVLEFTMPALLRAITAAEVQAAQAQTREEQPYICRVSPSGTLTLPAVGELTVAGRALAEVEEQVIEAYRRYVVLRPSVFVRVLEYRTSKAYIAGAVARPGVYQLKADQRTLASLLTEAGGIAETGAAAVRIIRVPAPAAPVVEPNELAAAPVQLVQAAARRSMLLPVVGKNIPFRDVALEEGDTVVVEHIRMPLFSVLGLVLQPGNFDYPPTAQYTLAQAIAYAGGLDPIADPRYVTIYRQGPDGALVRIALRLIEKSHFTEVLATPIRPGDVVAVEQTPRTRMNLAINNLVRINAGVYLTGNDLWNNE